MPFDEETPPRVFGNKELDKLLEHDGHAVLTEEYHFNGQEFVPVRWDPLPPDLVSFTLLPKQAYNNVAQILVLDPNRVEYVRVPFQVGDRETQKKQLAELEDQGYMVITQFGQDPNDRTYHQIGLRTKIPEAFKE